MDENHHVMSTCSSFTLTLVTLMYMSISRSRSTPIETFPICTGSEILLEPEYMVSWSVSAPYYHLASTLQWKTKIA